MATATPRTLYAGYPSALLYRPATAPDAAPPAKLTPLKELIWGDTLEVHRRSADGALLLVTARKTTGWIKAAQTQPEPLLEVVFVDIGQGDGSLIVMPDGRRYVVDAGEGDNMFRFLRWRFGFERKTVFEAALISHSDADHYGGFEDLFAEPNLHFKTVYSNGLMERAAASAAGALGPLAAQDGRRYATELVTTLAELKAFLAQPARWKGKKYPTMLAKALEAGRFADFRALKLGDKPLPGHGPTAKVRIELLGPVAEKVGTQTGLRWFGDVGKTKNGHSIVFRLRIGNVALFLGGDLNIESSRLLLEKHTGLSAEPQTAEQEDTLVRAARPRFQSDVAKACHHGSADTLLPLMRAIDPIATVVSSGDDEPYAHPRADALGAIAKCSRGLRPLLLSTELARSAKESIKHPAALRAELTAAAEALDAATTDADKAKAKKRLDELLRRIDRSVAVYGAINLRTDGTRVLLAYKLEQSRPNKGWDIYRLEPQGAGGPLAYVSKHAD
jgi:beta-lactamase superfamily II metal-dependent hydrolase